MLRNTAVTLQSFHSYEDPASNLSPAEAGNPLSAGLPSVWWPCISGVACLVYSAFWIGESWRRAQALLGPTKLNHLTQDLWCLILVLGSGYALYHFYKHRSETLGIVLCLAVAAAAMTWHRL
jgi:hypothetical protein